MTFTSDNTPTNADEAPKKPVRRRVTRATSAPVIAPVQFLTADSPAPVAPKTTSGGAAVVSGAPKTSDESSTASAPRKSRRVTSSGKATGSSVAVSGTATEIAAIASSANERAQTTVTESANKTEAPQETATGAETGERPARTRNSRQKNGTKKNGSKNLKAAVVAAAEVAEAQQPELDVFVEFDKVETRSEATNTGAAKKTRNRTNRSNKPAVDVDSEQATDTVIAEDVAQDTKPAERSEAKSNTRTRSRTRNQTATAKAAQPSAEPTTEAETPAKSSESSETKQTSRRNSRGRRTDVFSDARNEQPAVETATEEVAPTQRPRLATTALLFQAPDLSSVPARTVGAPIASAEEAEEEAEVAESNEETTEESATDTRQSPRNNRRERGRNRNRPRTRTEDSDDAETPVSGEDEDPTAEAELDADATEGDSDEDGVNSPRRRRRRGGRGRRNRSNGADSADDNEDDSEPEETEPTDENEDSAEDADGDEYSSSRRRRRRRRRGSDSDNAGRTAADEVTALKGSTRLEAKRQRRREGRDAGRRRTIITEAEFLARRESVERSMVVRERNGRTQIAVLEDGVLVEHYVSQQSQTSMAGNVYLGRVQNVLPSMEAAFVDIGKGRNAVLYAGEVNWDVHGIDGQPRRIEDALKSGDTVLVQVTKDPIGHKGARLTSQVTLAGRYLVYVPGGGMTGISRKLPDVERTRLKRILREVVPEGAGVIVRTAAEGASEEELTADIARLRNQWESIEKKSKSANAPALLQGEPDLAIRVVRDIFNDDFKSLKVQGDNAWNEISEYVNELAPDLAERVSKWVEPQDIFTKARIDEQLTKGMDRKVWLPSGGSLVIDRTEAMTVVDVNTGKFTGAGGTLEETVTRNNLEAAEEIVRQLRLRDIGGIIVIDFIDMVLESNRDLVLRRLVECLGRDRTKHQVAEVTSLGLVQMTRKRVGQGLVEAFSTNCDHCNGRGFVVHEEPNEKQGQHTHNNSPVVVGEDTVPGTSKRVRRKRNANKEANEQAATNEAAATIDGDADERDAVKVKLATIAAAAAHAHEGEELELTEQHEAEVDSAKDFPETQDSTDNADQTASSTEETVSEVQVSDSVKDAAATETVELGAGAQVEGNASEAVVEANADAQAVSGNAPAPTAEPAKHSKNPVLDVLAEFGLNKD